MSTPTAPPAEDALTPAEEFGLVPRRTPAATEPPDAAAEPQDATPDAAPRPQHAASAPQHAASAPQHAASGHAEPPIAAPRHDAAATTRSGQALVARGLTLSTRQGRVFGPVDFDLPPGTPGAVLGVQGSGRSAFLLALAGRMQGVTGSLQVGDLDGLKHPRVLRHRTAVARISDLVELEPTLTVAEATAEHALLDGVSVRRGRATFARLADAVGFVPEPKAVVGELPAVERTLLTALLACQRPAHHIVFDDIDDSLTVDQLERVYDALEVLGDLGHTFVVSALESSPVPHGAVSVVLPPPEASEGLALRFGHLHPRRITQEA